MPVDPFSILLSLAINLGSGVLDPILLQIRSGGRQDVSRTAVAAFRQAIADLQDQTRDDNERAVLQQLRDDAEALLPVGTPTLPGPIVLSLVAGDLDRLRATVTSLVGPHLTGVETAVRERIEARLSAALLSTFNALVRDPANAPARADVERLHADLIALALRAIHDDLRALGTEQRQGMDLVVQRLEAIEQGLRAAASPADLAQALGEILDEEGLRAYLESRGYHVTSPRATDRLFITPDEFRGRVAANVPFGYDGPRAGGDAAVEDIARRIAAGEPILVLAAPDGAGKTRICLDLAARLADDSTRTVLFVHPDVKAEDRHLAELDAQGRYVIVLDDAHETDDALRLARRLLGDGRLTSGVQIVATTHPGLADDIAAALRAPARPARRLTLEPIPGPDIDAMLTRMPYAITDPRVRAEIVALADGRPLLAHLAVRVVRDGRPLTGMHQDDLLGYYLDDIVRTIEQAGHPALRRYLSILVGLCKVEARHQSLRAAVRAAAGLDEMSEEALLAELERARIVRRNVHAIRVKPDLLAAHLVDSSFVVDGHPFDFAADIARPFLIYKLPDILIQAAEVDACRAGSAAGQVLSDFFRAIEGEVRTATNTQRLDALTLLERIALYRPDEALRIILPTIDGPAPTDEVIVDPIWGSRTVTHADVLEAAVARLGDTMLVRPGDSADALFALATYQPQVPGYEGVRTTALRALTAACAFDPLIKPYSLQAAVAGRLQGWLARPDGARVVRPLLPALLQSQFDTGHMLPGSIVARIYHGPLPADARTAPALNDIYTAAIARSADIYNAATTLAERLAVVDLFKPFINQMCHAGVSADLRAVIEDACERVVAVLACWAANGTTPLPVLDRIEQWARRAVELGLVPNTRARTLLDLPQCVSALTTYRMLALHPNLYAWGHGYKEALDAQERWWKQAPHQITQAPIDTWLSDLNRIVTEGRQMRGGIAVDGIGLLLVRVVERNLDLGRDVVERIESTHDALVPVLQWPLAELRRHDPVRFHTLTADWLPEPDPAPIAQLGCALARAVANGAAPDTADRAIIDALTRAPGSETDRALIACLPAFGELEPTAASSLTVSIAGRSDEALLRRLIAVLPKPSTVTTAGINSVRAIPTTDYRAIVVNLVRLDEIDHEVEGVLEQLAAVAPDAVVDLLEERIRATGTPHRPTYDAIPHGLTSPVTLAPLRASPDYVDLLRRVRDWQLRPDAAFRLYAGEALGLLSPPRPLRGGVTELSLDDPIAAVLREWTATGIPDHLVAVADLLKEFVGDARAFDLAREIVAAAHGDARVEEAVRGVFFTSGEAIWGPSSAHFHGRIPVLEIWRTDSQAGVYVRGFAERAIAILRSMATEADAFDEEALER